MRLIIIFLLFVFQSSAQGVFSGYVNDSLSGEPLVGVTIKTTNNFSVTNNYGFYTIYALSNDKITVSYIGYQTKFIGINSLNTRNRLNIELSESNQSLKELVVNGTTISKPSAIISTLKITNADIKNMPALIGEKDVIKTIQMLPGVQKGTEGTTALQVRGGGRDQNLILLDDAVVYNPNHLFGFFSVFNADAIKNVTFQKGGFDAKYGGRLSSIVDITTKEGNNKAFKMEGGIGLLSSRLLIEGPIIKDKLSFLFSGRRSYLDPILSLIVGEDNSKTSYRLYDFNAKLGLILNNKNSLYLSAYQGDDKFSNKGFIEKTKKTSNNNLQWGNQTYSLRWTSILSPKSFLSTIISTTYFKNEILDNVKNQNGVLINQEIINSGIDEKNVKLEIQNTISSKITHVGGVFYTRRAVEPDFYKLDSENQIETKFNSTKYFNTELGTYQQVNWVSGRFFANIGIRALNYISNQKTQVFLEPRLNFAIKVKSSFFKASYSKSNQFLNQLSTSNLGLPTDIWVPSTNEFIPSSSHMFGLAYETSFGEKLLFSSELYFKSLKNIFQFKEGIELFEFGGPGAADWGNRITQGNGISYGFEVLLSKKTGRFKGWTSYTWSKTIHKFAEINNSKPFYPLNDRRHDISTTGIYDLNKKIKLSSNWVLTSGARSTGPLGLYNFQFSPFNTYSPKDIATYFGNKNANKLPVYHRLDLAVELIGKQKKRFQGFWEFGIYNVYFRKNPYNFNLNRKITNNEYVFSVKYDYLLPILPYVNYNFKF